MTTKQIQKEITKAASCLDKEGPLEKKLEMAEWKGGATYSIKQAIKRNTESLNKSLEKLARAEMSGIKIDYECGTLATMVHEEKEEIEWKEGE